MISVGEKIKVFFEVSIGNKTIVGNIVAETGSRKNVGSMKVL